MRKLLPELNKLYPGDQLELKQYPDLKHIIQLGHETIRGVLKFRDVMLYANPQQSHIEIPVNESEDGAFVSYRDSK